MSDFAPYLLPIVFCSKSSLKEGKGGKRWGAKSLKKRIGGAKSHDWQKERGKSVIKHKDRVQNQKGGKKIGCKIAKKKRGCKITQLAKDRGKSAIKPNKKLMELI